MKMAIAIVLGIILGIISLCATEPQPNIGEYIGEMDSHSVYRAVDKKYSIICYTISSSHDIRAISCTHL